MAEKKKKKKKRRRFRQLRLLLHHGLILDHLAGMSGSECKVYIVIAMHANWHTGRAAPTFETISSITGIRDHRTIRSAIDSLEQRGLIKLEFRRAKSRKGEEHGRLRFFYQLTHPATAEYFRNRKKT